MKKWNIKINDLLLTMEAEYEARTKEEAEEMARNDYAVELDCSPEDVNIIEISEKQEEKKMKNITVETVMKYIPKKSQLKIAELVLEDLGSRKTRYHITLNENYWLNGNSEFQIENFKELLKVLKEQVIYDEVPAPWEEEYEDLGIVENAKQEVEYLEEKKISKTAYMKQMREFFKENMAGNTEEITFKEWFNEHMIGLELDGKLVKEIKKGKEVTMVII